MFPRSKAVLIYSTSKRDFKEVVDRVTRNANTANVRLETYDSDALTPSDELRFLTDIRSISSQTHGQIRSGKGRTLPISGRSKLNLSIPIIIIYDDLKAIDVYPKDMYTIDSAFKLTPSTLPVSVENDIVRILCSKPDLLEPGLVLAYSEFKTSTGVVDLIFKGKDAILLAVEVKEEANQESVGQVQKQSAGLKEEFGSAPIRRAIVALRISGSVPAACKEAGIDLYLLAATKLSL